VALSTNNNGEIILSPKVAIAIRQDEPLSRWYSFGWSDEGAEDGYFDGGR
jgi:hypothetical protein